MSQACFEGPGFLHIHKHIYIYLKKSGFWVAWLFLLLQGNNILNFYESKKVLPTYFLISYAYIGHTLLRTYTCLRVTDTSLVIYVE